MKGLFLTNEEVLGILVTSSDKIKIREVKDLSTIEINNMCNDLNLSKIDLNLKNENESSDSIFDTISGLKRSFSFNPTSFEIDGDKKTRFLTNPVLYKKSDIQFLPNNLKATDSRALADHIGLTGVNAFVETFLLNNIMFYAY